MRDIDVWCLISMTGMSVSHVSEYRCDGVRGAKCRILSCPYEQWSAATGAIVPSNKAVGDKNHADLRVYELCKFIGCFDCDMSFL